MVTALKGRNMFQQCGWGVSLWEGLKSRPERRKDSCGKSERKSISGRNNGMCKGLKLGRNWVC